MTILSRSGREAHLLEHRGAELAVGVAQALEQLGMAVIVATMRSTGLPAAFIAAAKSRACRWNSGVSYVP